MTLARIYMTCFLIYWTSSEAVRIFNNEEFMDQEWWATKTAKFPASSPNETSLNMTLRSNSQGYSATEHYVETEDGYGLTLFRLQRRSDVAAVKGPPVLLLPGLLLTSASWIDAGPSAGLAYLLSNAGYDVWLGDTRGTHYSRRHAWLDPDTDSQYWNFCVDEIGLYDVPAFIDYVLGHIGADKLNYIGFSQGASTFFIMCSERPGYCDKVNFMTALAPATSHLHSKSVLYRLLVTYFERHEHEFVNAGHFEAFPKGGFFQTFLQRFCSFSIEAINPCETLKDALDAPHPKSITSGTYSLAVTEFPAGTSVHNMARYGQSMNTKEFQRFDYGSDGNVARYGSRNPPVYNLSSVTVPTVVFYGKNDGLVDIKDVKWLLGKLPNVVEAVEVKDPLWSHVDMIFGVNVPKLAYPKIEVYLRKYNS